jgi:multiple sugar transport system ATP-binding protein
VFVAGFIGSPAMNFFNGTVKRNGAMEFQCVRQAQAAARRARCRRRQGRRLGVRPEHFALADDGAEAEIQVVEPTGSKPCWWRSSAARTCSLCFVSGMRSSPATPCG